MLKPLWRGRLQASFVFAVALMLLPFQTYAQSANPLLTPPPLREPKPIAPDLEAFTLENGMEVVVIPDRRAPVVTHMVWYKVGSADEPKGKSGIAHLLEHLMFKGTEANPGDTLSRTVTRLGGQQNAFTSYDYTAYFQQVAVEHLETMMVLEADRMVNLELTPDVTLPELSVVLEERASRVEGNPGARLGEAMAAASYVSSAYGRPIIGWSKELSELTYQDALDFYDQFYTPNNAVLVVAGDVNVEDVRSLAEKTYGQVERRADPQPRIRLSEPEPNAQQYLRLVDPQVSQASVRRSWIVPSYATAEPGSGEAEAFDVLAAVLGGGTTSLMHTELVLNRKIALSVGAFYSGSQMGEGRFAVFAVPVDGVSPDEVLLAMQDMIDKLSTDQVTQEEVDLNVRKFVASTIYAQDSQQTLARIFGASLATGGTIEEVQGWSKRMTDVVNTDVVALAATYLNAERSITGYLVPDPQAGSGADTTPPSNESD